MHNWKKIILSQADTMQTAISVLEEEALRIVLIVDDDERLVGTVTDGDIRRGLIKQLPMNIKLDEFMHRKPTVASINDDKPSILAKMKKLGLLQIPIVDDDERIVGLETLHRLLEKNKFDNPVLLMAGGFGKRLSPLTNETPKSLLRVGKKPILENILDQFISAGFHNFYISIYYKADMVQNYFGDGSSWGVSIKYVYENKPLGTAGSLGLLPSDLPKLPILMMNGDLLTKVCFEELLSFHLQEDGDVTMCVREYDILVPYGVIKADGSHVKSITEKPVHKFFVNAGVYVLNPSILNLVNGEDYMDMPQLIEKNIKGSGRVNMFPIHEYWLDIGQKEQFDQAQQDIEMWHD
jgi:dTDP-glucose pyrophosphorylase